MIAYSQACSDPNLFGPWFEGPTWDNWRVIDKALFGEPLNASEMATYRQLTGREDTLVRPASEAVFIIGRRGGKDVKAASLGVYLATIGAEQYGWRKKLTRGERGVVQILAVDRDQAGVCFRYIQSFFEQPILKRMVKRMSADTVELTNSLAIEVTTNDQRRVRGRTVVAAIFDEACHWRDENSSNPDEAIYQAVKPAMATMPGSMLIIISSPHARKGLVWNKVQKHYGQAGDVLVVKAPTWVMNPTLSRDNGVIAEAYENDPSWASAEYGGEFRTDVESFVSREILAACTANVSERLPLRDHLYVAFVDPSGGSSDSFTLAIAHAEGRVAVLDVVREFRPPFNPLAVVEDIADTLHRYGVTTVFGDRYAGETFPGLFQPHGISYEPSELSKSEIYIAFLPFLNSHSLVLLDHPRLQHQLLSLERRVTRGGRDTIDHLRGGYDDIANAVAGALVLAQERGDMMPMQHMQAYAINCHDPFASAEENAVAAARVEARLGYFSGPGWAPTWHGTEPQQTHAYED